MIETFWKWFLYPNHSRRTGYHLLFSKWILADISIATIMTNFLSIDGFAFAQKALFPAASILVSMAVAWTARAATVLNDKSFREKIVTDDNPLEDYIYGYQLSILIIMSTVVYISIMAAGGFNCSICEKRACTSASSFFLYFMLSTSIRECWSVVNFSNLLGLLHSKSVQ